MRTFTAAILIWVLSVGAQQPPAAKPAPPPAATADGAVKFSSTSQLVIETVSVKDKSGKSIEGLTAQDFIVTENGVPQTIRFCDYQKLDETAPADFGTPDASPATERPKVNNVTRNQIMPETPGDIRYRDRRLLALYFDMTAMPPPDQIRALTAAKKFIKTQMSGPDLVAVMAFKSGAVSVLQDFTADRVLLDKAIETLIVADENADENATDASSADTGAAFGQDDGEFNIFNTDRQLAALQTAMKMLGTLNEKKALVYFASGLRLNGIDNQAQMRSAVNTAVRANVNIFTVDARGLVAAPPLGDATQGSPGGQAMYTGQSAMSLSNNFSKSQDTLYSLAADTGGKALLDNNDLTRGVVQAQQSTTSYYLISYVSTNTALDGKFRKIKITVKEQSPSLAYREGYFAGKEFGKFNSTDKERQLEDALMMGDPMTELTIAMEMDYFQISGAEYYVPMVVKIPGSELARARKGGAEHTLIDFIGEIKDEYGTTVSNVRDKIDIKLTGQTSEQLSKHPIQYDTGFTLLPATYSVKFLARDAETGRIGTYINKFTIPNLNKVGATPEDKRLPISTVVLSSQRIDMKDALFTAGKNNTQETNPLVQDGQKLIPSVTRVFSKSKDMYVYLQAYQQSSEKPQPLIAYVTFYHGQAKAFETTALPVVDSIKNRLKTMPIRFNLTLEKLPPGRYNCQVTVIEPTGQKIAFWQAPIVLIQ